jgi:Protein of unknown function (DUF4241)
MQLCQIIVCSRMGVTNYNQQKYGMNYTDFAKSFQEGYTFQYKVPYDEVNDVTFSVQPIGELILTSGKLVACDPLLKPDLREYFTQKLKPDRYPVILSIASFRQRADQRIACAMLRISNQPPVRWEIARRAIDALISYRQEDILGYGVDSGTGCFMDLDAAQVLHTIANPDSAAYEAAWRRDSEQAWALSSAALDRFEQEYCDRLIAEMEKNRVAAVSDDYPHSRAGDWASIQISDATEANVIAFGSGWGDGGYPSFWGYDAQGKLTSLVTDFMLFGKEDEEDEESET